MRAARSAWSSCATAATCFPDSVATDRGDNPQWLYTVVFESRELWGPDADPTLKISIDAFEPYLDPSLIAMTDIDPAAARRATEAVPSIPCDAEGPVFREPWEAQAFAHDACTLRPRPVRWPEWAAILSDEIKKAQAAGDPDTGETYYRHWLAALERIVAEKGVTDARTLSRYYHAWDHAADRTPHGKPIELRPDDFG